VIFSKYIITKCKTPLEKKAWAPTYRPEERTQLLRLDEETVPGAKIFAQSAWYWPAMAKKGPSEGATKPHIHDYDEVLGLIGTDPDDPFNLCGESEITLGGEKHIVNKSALIYIPAGLEHGPMRQVKMDRPVIHFEFRNSGKHQ
jgi:hypothetical protein